MTSYPSLNRTSHLLPFFAVLLFILSACSPAYIKKIPSSYPHENPTEKTSSGTYIGTPKTQSETPSKPIATAPSTSNPLDTHAWQQADNGKYYKIGDPYKIGGRWYRPKEYSSFSQTGIASWYGPNFHRKKTANGGTFDKNIPSAAHKTLPIPSVIKVTNLENGKSIIVKVNDRGPYSKARILDLSEKAAEILNFKDNGTTKVNISYLHEESQQLKNSMQPLSSQNTKKTLPTPSIEKSLPVKTLPPIKTLPPKKTIPVIGSRSPAKKVTSPFPYNIQVGAFSQKSNATKLRDHLEKFYTNVFVVPSASLFKVHIGFPSLDDAVQHIVPVKNTHGFPSAFIIKP
jgi:rare lipoprotein A